MANSIEELKIQLQSIYDYMPHFGLCPEMPPVINIMGEMPPDRKTREDGKGGDLSQEEFSLRKEFATLRSDVHPIPGSRVFCDNIKHDIVQIEKFLARHATEDAISSTAFSTNAPYLIAVWNEIARAPTPVTYIDKLLNNISERVVSSARAAWKGFSKGPGAKVDVVADNGRLWIRVNTIKNSRILAEFREQDSYLTDSEEESQSGAEVSSKMQGLDNSLIQMGKTLVAAARASSLDDSGEGILPALMLRLTRLLLDRDSLERLQALGLKIVGLPQSLPTDSRENDPRIAQTVEELLRMGIEVSVGEHKFAVPPRAPPSASLDNQNRLIPSPNINLDLSVLIALVSDITHSPLPVSADEARTRFIPTPEERERSRRRRACQKLLQTETASHQATTSKRRKGRGAIADEEKGRSAEDSDTGESIHSRALANQALREMRCSLLDEMIAHLGADSSAQLRRFWVSREVRARCLRIVAKIGGPAERRRVRALLACMGSDSDEEQKSRMEIDAKVADVINTRYVSSEEACAEYWQGSRHTSGRVPGLVPLNVYDDDVDITTECVPLLADGEVATDSSNTFWSALAAACHRLLASGTVAHPRALLASSTAAVSRATTVQSTGEGADGGDSEIARAAVTRANPCLTAHTVGTLGHSAARRWTTLTANRAAVREVLRESERVRTCAPAQAAGSCLAAAGSGSLASGAATSTREEVAAIWVVEPRSLAESMRGGYVPSSESH